MLENSAKNQHRGFDNEQHSDGGYSLNRLEAAIRN
jgi:hypothetical protein